MSKNLNQFFFPIFITFIFTIFPLLFSFDQGLEKINKNTTNQFQNTNTVSLTAFKLFKPKIVEEVSNKQPVVPYNKERISIYSEAMVSLMNYNFPMELPDTSMSNRLTIGANNFKKSTIFTYPAFIPNNLFKQPLNSGEENDSYQYVKEFFFNNHDKYNHVIIGQPLLINAHCLVNLKHADLPREVNKIDKEVKFKINSLENMFLDHYDDYFEFNSKKKFPPRSTLNNKRYRKKLLKYWRSERHIRDPSVAKIREALL